MDKLTKDMMRLAKPIDEAIMMCDDRNEVLMLASMMQVKLKDIYDAQIGVEGRREMFLAGSKS